ncbi:MAG: response regulator [Candidatus Omnitrophica bacterium]|nr:response regulator [Candidatus Omnitrophota bacterium]
MANERVLIIEDDPDIVEMISYNLQKEGYKIISALNGEDGLYLARRQRPDLIILDIMLPERDGFDICKTLRNQEATSQIPIIILSARSQEADKIVGLELGADDYVTKPFSPRELLARIKALFRRVIQVQPKKRLEIGELVIDTLKHKVTVSSKLVSLSPREFKLLDYLARKSGLVCSREEILDKVFGYESDVYDRTIDAHIKSLRKKLKKARDYIETVRGSGYRLRDF